VRHYSGTRFEKGKSVALFDRSRAHTLTLLTLLTLWLTPLGLSLMVGARFRGASASGTARTRARRGSPRPPALRIINVASASMKVACT
jgi:hypothetical protein